MDQSLEQWRPVAGYEGLYEVSDQGRVRSLTRIVSGKRFQGKLLNPYAGGRKGYLQVWLASPNRKKFYLHYLVARAFHGERPLSNDCRHLNDNHLDNRAVNLAWGTRSQNIQDAILNGKIKTGLESVTWKQRTRNSMGRFT